MSGPHIQTPKVVTPEQAYISAIAALGGSIQTLSDQIAEVAHNTNAIDSSLSILADYLVKKGKQEGIFSDEDYPEGGDEEIDEVKPDVPG